MPEPSRRLLSAQSKFLKLHHEVYVEGTPGERKVALNKFVQQLSREAKLAGVKNIPAHVEQYMKGFPVKESDVTEPTLVKTNSSEIRRRRPAISKTPPPPKPPPPEVIDEDDERPYEEQEGGVKVYHNGGSLPPKEENPQRRDGPTIGDIVERVRPPVADLVGDRVPRTLTDLYARWPIADDPQFFLRIERTKPKRFQGLDVAGFVGEVRGRAISEAEIQRKYGGNEYKITLFGPDPRGGQDGEGDLVIKALTDPITMTVPVLPPIVTALPEDPSMYNQMNPFGHSVAPTSAGDAAIHKANSGFFSEAMKLQHSDAVRREVESGKATSNLLTFMSESQKQQLEATQRDSQRREDLLKEQLAEAKAAVEREKIAQGTVAAEVARAKDEGSNALMQLVAKMGPDKEAEVRRLADYYTQQTEVLRRSHDDQIKGMRDRHEGDLRRADERVKDTEANYRQMLEQERTQSRQMLEGERSQWTMREKDLREQMREQTDAERKMAQQRIDDMKERHAAEVRQMEKAHERELRTIKESSDVKLSVSETTHKMSLQHAMERLEDAKADVERAREEAAEASDLSAQLEKMERQASLLGFEKKDADAPKGAWERFAATAGAGLSQALSSANEWVPQALAARQQAQSQQPQQQQRALPQQPQRVVRRPPPQPQQQQQQASPQQRQTRGAQWAAEGVQVSTISDNPEPLGFQPEPIAQAPAAKPSNPVQVAPPVPAAPSPEEEETVDDIQLPPKFLQFFPQEAMLGFLAQAENAVNTHVDPDGFASLMLGSGFEEGAQVLISQFQPTEVSDAIKVIPGAETSPLLRRDGKKWLEGLWKALRRQLAEKAPKTRQ